MEADTLTHKRCPRCEQHKLVTEYYKSKKSKDGFRWVCKECCNEQIRSNPHTQIFAAKKYSAKINNIEFTITKEDVIWNEYCPALGVKLDYNRVSSRKSGMKPNSPSFDRIDPNKGYIPGNVVIVSAKANTIKSNATITELQRLTAFYAQLIPQVGEQNASEDHRMVPHSVE